MTALNSPWTASGMAAANKPHEAPVRAFLTALVKRPQDHARFMNMLSMLEHKGSRKIMLSQMDGTLTEDSLKHLAEEARHAYFFKRQAERVAGRVLDGYTEDNTMALVPALMYFGRLDAGINKVLLSSLRKQGPSNQDQPGSRLRGNDKHPKAYPWVSMIVELRACWLYHIYQDVLQKSDVKLSLKSLLAEEDMHLAEMFEMVGGDTESLRRLSAYETELFTKFWAQISPALSQAAVA